MSRASQMCHAPVRAQTTCTIKPCRMTVLLAKWGGHVMWERLHISGIIANTCRACRHCTVREWQNHCWVGHEGVSLCVRMRVRMTVLYVGVDAWFGEKALALGGGNSGVCPSNRVGTIWHLVTPVERTTITTVWIHLLRICCCTWVVWIVLLWPSPCLVKRVSFLR